MRTLTRVPTLYVFLLIGVLLLPLAVASWPLTAWVWGAVASSPPPAAPNDPVPALLVAFAVLGGAVWLSALGWVVLRAVGIHRLKFRVATEGQMLAHLETCDPLHRRLALQTVADRVGQPFGLVACWPVQLHMRAEFDSLVSLYKAWLRIRAWLRTRAHLREGVGAESPRTLNRDEFVEAMRGRTAKTLGRIADALNRVEQGRPADAAEAAVRDVLAALVVEALELGLRLRLDGAAQGHGVPRPHSERLLDRAADAVKDAMLDWDPDGDDQPQPERVPLPPLEPARFAESLRGRVDEFLRSLADEMNAAPDVAGMEAAEDDVRALAEHFVRHAFAAAEEMRLDAAAARLGPAAGEGQWAKKLRRMAADSGAHDPVV
jgi:hypothetical protein